MIKRYLISVQIVSVLVILTFLTGIFLKEIISIQFNNQGISDGSHARDESVSAWNATLSQGNFFEEVQSLDSFISPSNEDAYERNSGDFFAKTGIRLGLSLRPVDLWSIGCLNDSKCQLPEFKSLLQNVADSRIKRRVYFPRSLLLDNPKDWIDYQSENKTLLTSDTWYFNFVPIGAGVHLAILGLVQYEDSTGTVVDGNTLKGMAIYANYADTTKSVQINNVCLPQSQVIDLESKSLQGWKVRQWSKELQISDLLDMRKLEWGFCDQ
jgi:hypothetical protein